MIMRIGHRKSYPRHHLTKQRKWGLSYHGENKELSKHFNHDLFYKLPKLNANKLISIQALKLAGKPEKKKDVTSVSRLGNPFSGH